MENINDTKSTYILTPKGRDKASQYIRELIAKRKEILDAGLDTADETTLPGLQDIEADIEFIGVDEQGDYYNSWGVTDHFEADQPLSLTVNEDFVEA